VKLEHLSDASSTDKLGERVTGESETSIILDSSIIWGNPYPLINVITWLRKAITNPGEAFRENMLHN
jgi:hypothetical protein